MPLPSGAVFDNSNPRLAGQACTYWLGEPPGSLLAPAGHDRLAACEMLLYVVSKAPPPDTAASAFCWPC